MTRQVPAFDTLILGPKRSRYALVIPVINEGERLRRQLRHLATIAPRADIIIADGGSVDGSVDPAFLAEVGVRVRLTKTGPGRLSAQLRMAYAWCLDEGYTGVVTVDGNGKDGLEAIGAFIAKLDEGYAYVQGSRYVRGGAAINTPLDRKVAGRLIHAPLLSLAGRRWLTDTTNGFRGYSAAYLADPRVDPFRDIFRSYALLFYLTIRAGQLGYRTCEIPVSRSYPAQEKAPTKVSGFRGRANMMRELFDVVCGRYNPAQADMGRRRS
jgi:dolichol-phosphate mannosyltransferase